MSEPSLKNLIGHHVRVMTRPGAVITGVLYSLTRSSAWIVDGDDDLFVPRDLIVTATTFS